MKCKKELNLENCNCTHECSKKGICCECLHYHLKQQQLPACCFLQSIADSTERSFKKFVELHQHLLEQ